MELREVLERPEYEFLHQLNRPILFLTFGGSHAYGTNNENSDIDIRGCVLNRVDELLGRRTFDAYKDPKTDTTIYGFNRLINLLLSCNPAIIEMLGCKPEHYVIPMAAGKILLENRKLFLSKQAVYSFGGYANRQLRQLRTYLADTEPSQAEKESQLLRTTQHMADGIQYRYPGIPSSSIRLYMDRSEKPNLDVEVFADINMEHVPLRTFNSICNEMANTCNTYEKIGKRNTKKDTAHLNKHIMHLFRLYLMAFDILEKGEIVTYREADHDFLMDIRNGRFLQNGDLTEEFEETLFQFDTRLQYDKKNSDLPELPDLDKVNDLMVEINRTVVC